MGRGPQSPLPSPPPHPSPVALGAVVLKSCPLDSNLSQFPEKPLGFRSRPRLSCLSYSDLYCSPGAGSQATTRAFLAAWCLLGCLDRAVRAIASRARRKTGWTAELAKQITFQVPSGTAAFSTLVLASHNWIYPSRDNGSPGPPWRRSSHTRNPNGVLLRFFPSQMPPWDRGAPVIWA